MVIASDKIDARTDVKDVSYLPSEIKILSRRSNLRGIFAILRDIIAIAAIAYINIRTEFWQIYIPSIWAIGAFQFAMSECLVHEAAHWNLFRSRRLNDLCEMFIALPFLQTIKSYRKEHRIHHSHMLKKGDNILEEYKSYGLFRDKESLAWLWFVKPLIGYSAIMMVKTSQSNFTRSDFLKVAIFWGCLSTVSWCLGEGMNLILYWVVPLILCRGAFLYWSEISDHFRASSGIRTRTGRLANLIFHNNGYHHVHHRHPGVTYFNYKKAHLLLAREGDDVSSGFFETYKQIKQNVGNRS
jgi:fatty acid desaturase